MSTAKITVSAPACETQQARARHLFSRSAMGPRWAPRACLVALALWGWSSACQVASSGTDGSAQRPGPGSLREATAGMEELQGFLHLWLDRAKGRILLELSEGELQASRQLLYVEGLRTGLGSNPVGLDRGQLGSERVVAFRRFGDRVLLHEPNLDYRASSREPAERRAAEESFATSVLWAGEIEAEEAGRVLVDLTSFIVRDAHGVVDTLRFSNQGSFGLDAGRSVLDPDACLAFPDNVELEAWLTFEGDGSGGEVRDVAPAPDSVTLVQHHSFVRLPELGGYTPRRFDPRMGHNSIGFADYSAPLTGDVPQRLATRHRSPSREPIVYYVDRGAPEPVRSALLEGASWWAAAFDAAGHSGGYRVELLPEGVHPLDVRYNVIQWVHRSTRGWSYGTSVQDPRTGEILKGHVSLGSLRVRQDRLLFEGLFGADATGQGGPNDPVELALARLRQLSAHEVGHTLGFAHNFAASSYGRASVMDYPAPWIRPGAGDALDASEAYGVGLGLWDFAAVDWLYRDFAPGSDEATQLERLASRAPLFLTDHDARPAGAAHPSASLWDNGDDPVIALEEALEVRRRALERFGSDRIPRGASTTRIEEALAPLYFYHRYQVDAAAKVLGGLEYRHGLRGDGPLRPAGTPPASAQLRALDALLSGLEPAALDLPEEVLGLLGPTAPGAWSHREVFGGEASPGFDALGAAATAADLVLAALLQPERALRVVDQARRDRSYPGWRTVLERVFEKVFAQDVETARWAEIRRTVQGVLIARCIELAQGAPQPVRVRTRARLTEALGRELSTAAARADASGYLAFLRHAVETALEGNRPDGASVPRSASAPPGSPIGAPTPAAQPPESLGCTQGQLPALRGGERGYP